MELVWARLGIGLVMLALAAYLGITRDRQERRVQRVSYLFGLIFFFFAMWVGSVVVSMIASSMLDTTPENYEFALVKIQLIVSLLVGLPGLALVLRLVSMRCRDAGYVPRLAYLGVVPLLQIFFIFWMIFPKPISQPATAAA